MVAFQMWEPYRQSLLMEHGFYVEQAKKRLLSQFDNIGAEADQAAEGYLEEIRKYFNPDTHDPSDFYEAAHDKGMEFYGMLNDMRNNTRLGVVAGAFHQWDKKLRQWIVSEMRHWHRGEHSVRELWKQDFSQIMDLLASFGWDVRSIPLFERLDAMRLAVNVFKHGDGKSLEDLKERFPEYLLAESRTRHDVESLFEHLDYTALQVTDDQIQVFFDAISAFWDSVPASIPLRDVVDVPKWFEKAFEKDREAGK